MSNNSKIDQCILVSSSKKKHHATVKMSSSQNHNIEQKKASQQRTHKAYIQPKKDKTTGKIKQYIAQGHTLIRYKEKQVSDERKIQQIGFAGDGKEGAPGALTVQLKLCEAGQMCFKLPPPMHA